MLRIGIFFVALVTLAVASTWYYFEHLVPVDKQQPFLSQKDTKHNIEQAPPEEKYIRIFRDTAFRSGFPYPYPRPKSQWKVREKEQYLKLLERGGYDVLVVPFQVDNYAFDRPTRSLMTAELSYAISERTDYKLPDPYLLSRAFGDGERKYKFIEVHDLAKKLGVKKVIWTHVGHSRSNQMELTVQVLETGLTPLVDITPEPGKRKFSKISFSGEKPPIDVYHSMLPEILSALDMDIDTQINDTVIELLPKGTVLPENPMVMFSDGSKNSLQDAYYYQFLAYLTPSYDERTRERFIEKSLLAIYKVSPSTPGYRALKARAYMQLGLRPAAIHILGEPINYEEKAILAALNGNLHELRELTPLIESQFGKLFAKFDENKIAAHYSVINKKTSIEAVKSLNLPGEIWPFLVARSLTDWDDWSQFDNIQLKQLLDYDFPIPDYTTAGIIKGAQTLGDMSKVSSMMDLSVIKHVDKLMVTEPHMWCCEKVSSKPKPIDYIDLISGIATDNLMRRAKYFLSTQGNPSRAQKYLDSIETMYKGYPQYALYRGMTNAALANKKGGVERESLLEAANLNAINAAFWARGQTRVSADAFTLRNKLRRRDFGKANNPYISDYPIRPFYPSWERASRESVILNAKAALNNSSYNFRPVRELSHYFNNDPERMKEVLDSVKGRFAGNTYYMDFMASNSMIMGNFKEAEKYYRDGIEISPEQFDYYLQLGTMLVESGRIQEAYDLFMSWPGFLQNSDEPRVLRSNVAYLAGSLFYWSGHNKYAVPLYRISADLDTGSDASMASALRLHILNDEYALAMQGSLERAKRYNSSYAYRDYLGMLHVTGNSREAWDAFNLIVNRQNQPHIWEAALVGHRLESLSQSEIAEWTQRYKQLISETGDSFAAIYLLRSGVTDRIPNKKLVEQIQMIDQPVWQLEGQRKHVIRNSPDGLRQIVLGPKIGKAGGTLPISRAKNSNKKAVKSDLAYFAESYRAIRLYDYREAALLLDAATHLYNTNDVRFGYLLPYYAYVSAKTGETTRLDKILKKFTIENQRFDYHLAKAVLAGLSDNLEESNKHLDLALYRRPHTESRPLFTEYQYAEVCELLYEATKKPEYKKRLLDWSKKSQQVFPWHSWSYTMIAKHSSNTNERRMAIAMGYYLDKDSERLKAIPASEIKTALDKYSGLNPFLSKNRVKPTNKQSI